MNLVIVILLSAGLLIFALWAWASAREGDNSKLVETRLRGGFDDGLHSEGDGGRVAPAMSAPMRYLTELIWRTGSEVTVQQIKNALLLFVAVIPLLIFSLGWFTGLIFLSIVSLFVYAFLYRQGQKRRLKILSQLPDFIESVIRILSAGNTLERSIAAAAAESTNPIKPLFESVGRQVRLGATVEDVLGDLGEIHRLRDLKVMAMAASINRRYGGSLRNVLRSLIHSIRTRDTAARELRALTAEARFSAVVLAIIPVAITLYILVRNPGYYTDIWEDFSGRAMLIVSAGMQGMGVFVLWRMLRSIEDTDE